MGDHSNSAYVSSTEENTYNANKANLPHDELRVEINEVVDNIEYSDEVDNTISEMDPNTSSAAKSVRDYL